MSKSVVKKDTKQVPKLKPIKKIAIISNLCLTLQKKMLLKSPD